MLKSSKILSLPARAFFTKDCLLRSKHSNEGLNFRFAEQTSTKSGFQQPQNQEYPATERLPLPSNIVDLASSETLNFSPQRTRDISGSFISSSLSQNLEVTYVNDPVDDRIECYDSSGGVNLSSSMQTNVPEPFIKEKPTHLNMPGGQWKQREKYMSEDLHKIHHCNIKSFKNSPYTLGIIYTGKNPTYLSVLNDNDTPNAKKFCTMKDQNFNGNIAKADAAKTEVPKLTVKQKFQTAARDYGTVFIVFHVGTSLISLGCCYLAVISGINLDGIIKFWGIEEGAVTAGAVAKFVIAYAIHKSTAPIRIGISVSAVPFIVAKFRKLGFLKPIKKKPPL